VLKGLLQTHRFLKNNQILMSPHANPTSIGAILPECTQNTKNIKTSWENDGKYPKCPPLTRAAAHCAGPRRATAKALALANARAGRPRRRRLAWREEKDNQIQPRERIKIVSINQSINQRRCQNDITKNPSFRFVLFHQNPIPSMRSKKTNARELYPSEHTYQPHGG
jgi:hypothetical protein